MDRTTIKPKAIGFLLGVAFPFTATLQGLAVDAKPVAANTNLVSWVYEATGSGDSDTKLVKDPDALDGEALECAATSKNNGRSYTVTTGYTMEYIPGEYEVIFRVKVSDNSGDTLDPDNQYVMVLGLEGSTPNVWAHIRAAEFKAPGKYQEFVFPFTIPNPVLNICVLRRYTGPTMWIDRITVVQKHAYTDKEQLKISGFKRPAEPKLVPHEGFNVWFAKGLYYKHYHLHAMLESMGAHVDYSYFTVGQRGSALTGTPFQGEPPKVKLPDPKIETTEEDKEPAELKMLEAPPVAFDPYAQAMKYDLVVLCDVDAACLSPLNRVLIYDFVKAGGGLLIVGGPLALGRGSFAEKSEFMSELLPVTLTGLYDLKSFAQPMPLQPGAGGISKEGLAWNQAPQVLWAHRTQPKQGATVELTAGDVPALVTWKCGKGRVAVLSATVLGEMDGKTPFWEWKDWPKLMTRVVQWLREGDSHGNKSK